MKFGRAGGRESANSKSFTIEEQAFDYYRMKILGKTHKGYVEIGADGEVVKTEGLGQRERDIEAANRKD